MKISINKTQIIKNSDGKKQPVNGWLQFTNSFQNVDITISELIDHIQLGHSYAACHKPPRSTANFICANHVDLDFDPRVDIETGEIISPKLNDLLNDKFIQQYASFIYTTYSHTKNNPRYRVFFELERETCKPNAYEALRRGLIRKYSLADEACSDACHLMFGANGCQVWPIGNVMPFAAAQKIVNEQIEHEKLSVTHTAINKPAEPERKHSDAYLANRLQWNLEKIANARDGTKHYTRRSVAYTVGGMVAGGYYDRKVLHEIIRAALDNTNDPYNAKKTIETAFNAGMNRPIYNI